jgi:cell fate regulator YaaT (PSP1 superfamily)
MQDVPVLVHAHIGKNFDDSVCLRIDEMPTVVGIRFKDSGKTYYFDPAEVGPFELRQYVIVETARGLEMARVAELPHDVDESAIVGELKPVIRFAAPEDEVRWTQLNSRQSDLIERCQEKITEHELPMSLVKAEYSFDGSRLTFYFTADKRVDFRNLVRDLARTFRTRIELRQIGPRDEAKLLGGIGPCGRILCCASFLPDYARVSIKMAKDQDLPLNPAKISGVCGRLLCCLAYEHEQYIEMKAEMPKRGTWVQTPDGPGEVTNVNVLRGTVTVTLAASGVQEEFVPAVIAEATNEVANVARSRNHEGVTPVVRERNRGERRFLRDEFESSDELAALADLEDRADEMPADVVGGAQMRRNEAPRQRRDGERPNRESWQGRQREGAAPRDRDRGYKQGGPTPAGRDSRPVQRDPSKRDAPSERRPPRPERPERPVQQSAPQGEREQRRTGPQDRRPPRPERPRQAPHPRQADASVPSPVDDQYSVPDVNPAPSSAPAENRGFRRRRRPNNNNGG